MPVRKLTVNGETFYQWGTSGKMYKKREDAEKQGYPDYLAKLLPLVRPGGLILGHDMNRPRPDHGYIEAITKNPHLETSFVMMEGFGISVTLKKR